MSSQCKFSIKLIYVIFPHFSILYTLYSWLESQIMYTVSCPKYHLYIYLLFSGSHSPKVSSISSLSSSCSSGFHRDNLSSSMSVSSIRNSISGSYMSSSYSRASSSRGHRSSFATSCSSSVSVLCKCTFTAVILWGFCSVG